MGKNLLLDLLRGLHAGLQHHEGLHLLHPVAVLHTDDGAHEDALVGVDGVFHLGGVDIVAAGDNQPLHPLLEVHKAFLVHGAQIAGVEPQVAVFMELEGLGGLLGVIHVALHDGGAADADFAHGAVGHLVMGGGGANLEVGIGEGNADAALPVGKPGGKAAGGDALRQAVALPHLLHSAVLPEEGIHLVFQLHAQGVAAGENTPQAAQIQLLGILHPKQCLVQRGNAGNAVGLVFAEHLAVGLDTELGHQNHPNAPVEHGVDADTQAEAVENGHDGKAAEARLDTVTGGAGLEGQGIEVQVGQEDSLGDAGSAAGVENHRRVLTLALVDILAAVLLTALQEILPQKNPRILGKLYGVLLNQGVHELLHAGQTVGDVANQQGFQVQPVTDFLKLGVELPQGQAQDALRVIDVAHNLLLAGEGVNHVGHGANPVDGIKQNDSLGGVGHTDGDPLSHFHALSLQGPGCQVNLVNEIFIGHLVAKKVIGHALGVALGGGFDGVHHGAVVVLEVYRQVPYHLVPGGLYPLGLRVAYAVLRNGMKNVLMHIHSCFSPVRADPEAPGGHRCVE